MVCFVEEEKDKRTLSFKMLKEHMIVYISYELLAGLGMEGFVRHIYA